MGAGELQGWHADPFHLHEARYFSAGQPTKLVRDGRAESFDEPPSGPPAPAAATVVALAPAPALLRESPPGWAVPYGAAPTDPYDPGLGRRRPTSPLSILTAVVLIAAAAALGALAFADARAPKPPPVPGTGTSPAAFVTQSARQTLGQRTADITVTGSAQLGSVGSPVQVQGSGVANFAANSMAVNITYKQSARSWGQSEIQVGGSLYLKESVNGKAATLPGGRTWIQMPVKNDPSTDITGSNPRAALSALAAQGNTVTGLGTRVIGGVTCSGYSVRLRALPIMTFTVWIDSGSLVRELGADLGSAVRIDFDFTHFGVPAHISAPPKSSVLSYQAFFKDMGLSALANLPGLGTAPPKAG